MCNKLLSLSLSLLQKFSLNNIKRSFTIIELSVALVVAGIIAGGGFTAYKNSNPQLRSDLKKIQESMQSFFNTNGRLPYPAYYKDDKDGENYLKENLTNIKEIKTQSANANQQENQTIQNKVLFGVVPTRTLGLNDDYAYDSYGKNIEYVVNSALTEKIGDENNEYKKADYNVNKEGKYIVSYKNKINENEVITIMPNLSITKIKTNQTTKNAGYILMSKQKQKKCFISIKSNTFEENLPNDNEKIKNNCFANEIIERFYQGYSKDFDEIVVFKSLNDMIYSLSNENETVNEMTQGNIIQYQPRISKKLETEKKDVVGAINEVNNKFKIVRVLDKTQGEEDVLYYLTKDTEDYNAGLYVWDTETEDYESVGGGSGDGTPVGTIISYGGKEIPYGYLLCDGKKYNRTIYKELFNAIGTSYGAGDGSTTFAVPNLNQRFIEGTTADEQVGKYISAGLPNISGSLTIGDGAYWGGGSGIVSGFGGSSSEDPDRGNWGSSTAYFSAQNSNPIYGRSSTVQPASLRVKYLIKYTKKQEKKKDENVLPPKSQLQPQDITFICEAMYPVGSVYINYVDARNPEYILLCGKWESINTNYYLMSVSPAQNNADYDAYNNAYGNFANTYLGECLPNITGNFTSYSAGHGGYLTLTYRMNGVFYSAGGPGFQGCNISTAYCFEGANGIGFNATRSSHRYRDNCLAVRPASYGVYMWKRTG